MVRRSPKAARKFANRYEAATLSRAEYLALRVLDRNGMVDAARRKILVSKGLVTSHVASKCSLTIKGTKSVQKYEAEIESENVRTKSNSHMEEIYKREEWLQKHAPPFMRASA